MRDFFFVFSSNSKYSNRSPWFARHSCKKTISLLFPNVNFFRKSGARIKRLWFVCWIRATANNNLCLDVYVYIKKTIFKWSNKCYSHLNLLYFTTWRNNCVSTRSKCMSAAFTQPAVVKDIWHAGGCDLFVKCVLAMVIVWAVVVVFVCFFSGVSCFGMAIDGHERWFLWCFFNIIWICWCWRDLLELLKQRWVVCLPKIASWLSKLSKYCSVFFSTFFFFLSHIQFTLNLLDKWMP